MAMKYYKTLMVLILCVSCEEQSNLFEPGNDSTILIVEGILSNEKRNHIIKLSHPHATQNENPRPATGAIVTIAVDNLTYSATESPAGSGNYLTEEFTAVFGKVYTLSILYNGKEYIARDGSVPIGALLPFQYQKTEKPFFYRLMATGNTSEASFTTHEFDWRNTTFCESGSACQGKIVLYDLKTIDANEIFKPDKTDFIFPVDATLIRRKYSVSPAFKEFLRGLLSETEWRGGYFDAAKANPSGNVSGGAMGFFAVTTVLSDTTKIIAIP
jgi:hypothetical protein